MKKIYSILVLFVMMISLCACGISAEPQTTVLVYQEDNVYIEYQIESNGDIVETIIQTSIVDTNGFTQEMMDTYTESIEYCAVQYAAIEGVTYETEVTDAHLKEILTMDVSNTNTIQSLSGSGLLTVDGDSDKISRSLTIENLEELGFVVKE